MSEQKSQGESVIADTLIGVAEQKTVKEMAGYINNFLTNRFPSGLNDPMRTIVSEIIMDAFFDGARWNEAQTKEESRVIQEV